MLSNHAIRQNPPSLDQFQARFPDEESCARYLFQVRWGNGWKCIKCGHHRYYPIATRKLYECARCGHQTSVTAGTIFHKTRTPLRLWFLAAMAVAIDKRGISSVGLSRYLGKSQNTAWTKLQKMRSAILQTSGDMLLSGVVELAELFFRVPKDGGPRGKGPRNKTGILVALSFDSAGHPDRLAMRVMPGTDRERVNKLIAQMVEPGAVLLTNRLRTYRGLSKSGFEHYSQRRGEKPEILSKWIQVIISNLRALFGGTYHGLGPKHMSAYLAEYCFRFRYRNQLNWATDALLHVMVRACPRTYRQIVQGHSAQGAHRKANSLAVFS